MTRWVGVDVGGSKRAAVLLEAPGGTVATAWEEHRGDWHGRIVDSVLASVATLLGGATLEAAGVDGVGVAVAGLVAADRATLVRSPMIREGRVDLGRALEAGLERPVTVHNDANATLYAIAQAGTDPTPPTPSGPQGVAPPDATSGEPVRLLLTVGTGLGGAIMIGDRLLVGEHGFAAELGHVIVEPADPRTCVCGSRGCAEQFASGRGIAELAAAEPPPGASGATLAALGLRPPLSARDVVVLADRGDGWAAGLLERAGRMLGRAIAILCVTLDPTTVTVAGTLGHAAGGWLLPAAERELRERWTYPADRPLPRPAVDGIGPYAAATGAALLAAASARERHHG